MDLPIKVDLPIKMAGELLQAKIPQHVQWYAEYFSAFTGKNAMTIN